MSKNTPEQAINNLLETTEPIEVLHSLSRMILFCDTTKLNDMDKLNLSALQKFLKQIDQT